MNLYTEPKLFQATVWMDDGDDPVSTGGYCKDFTRVQDARTWAKLTVDEMKKRIPAPEGTPGWYGLIETGHYVRDGETGIDELDYSWDSDEQGFVERIV